LLSTFSCRVCLMMCSFDIFFSFHVWARHEYRNIGYRVIGSFWLLVVFLSCECYNDDKTMR
jgi:hypothetical protein